MVRVSDGLGVTLASKPLWRSSSLRYFSYSRLARSTSAGRLSCRQRSSWGRSARAWRTWSSFALFSCLSVWMLALTLPQRREIELVKQERRRPRGAASRGRRPPTCVREYSWLSSIEAIEAQFGSKLRAFCRPSAAGRAGGGRTSRADNFSISARMVNCWGKRRRSPVVITADLLGLDAVVPVVDQPRSPSYSRTCNRCS